MVGLGGRSQFFLSARYVTSSESGDLERHLEHLYCIFTRRQLGCRHCRSFLHDQLCKCALDEQIGMNLHACIEKHVMNKFQAVGTMPSKYIAVQQEALAKITQIRKRTAAPKRVESRVTPDSHAASTQRAGHVARICIPLRSIEMCFSVRSSYDNSGQEFLGWGGGHPFQNLQTFRCRQAGRQEGLSEQPQQWQHARQQQFVTIRFLL